MNRLGVALAATLSAAVLAGCGGSAESTASPTSTATDLAATATDSLGQASPGLASATADVRRVAPKLEQYYLAKGYPRDLKGAKASMKPARQKLTKGNKLAGYSFDEKAKEFVLCVQHKSGAWATYDTAPMATGATGEAGGCPQHAGTGHGVVGPKH